MKVNEGEKVTRIKIDARIDSFARFWNLHDRLTDQLTNQPKDRHEFLYTHENKDNASKGSKIKNVVVISLVAIFICFEGFGKTRPTHISRVQDKNNWTDLTPYCIFSWKIRLKRNPKQTQTRLKPDSNQSQTRLKPDSNQTQTRFKPDQNQT